MKRTATITFHAAHNYGSMLQAFGLQQTLLKMGYENEIINLRTNRQTKLYTPYYHVKVRSIKTFARWVISLLCKKEIEGKHYLFESFLANNLLLTKEYKTLEQLQEADLSYDAYISGGDQIWNISPIDFDWSYYLPFVKFGKRISYAVSMGPHADTQVTQRDRVRECLMKYDHISVREEGTAELVSSLVDTPVSQEIDPALLLTKEEWVKHYDNTPLVKGDYILLYSPSANMGVYDVAKKLSADLHMKVILTFRTRFDWGYGFDYAPPTGPWEFLNLMQHARLVVSGSFHALVFATLYHIPFFAVNGDKDNRMKTFLKRMSLAERTINIDDYQVKAKQAFDVDFTPADEFLAKERERSKAFLKAAIGD